MASIDIGCGYLHNLHYPSIDCDVGLDINLYLSDLEFRELWKDRNLIMSSAEDLPFRSEVFNREELRAILEHLPNPIKALNEVNRTLVKDGYSKITIPIIVSHQKDYLQKIIFQFPFSIWDVYKCMKRMYPHIKTKGFTHQTDIGPEHIVKRFRMFDIKEIRYRHKWFYGVWGRIIKRILTNGKEPLKDKQGYYEILIRK